MKKQLLVFLLLLNGFAMLSAQTELLQSGPMLGYTEMRETLIWVQTKSPAAVHIAYWPINTTPVDTFYTSTELTEKSTAYTAHLLADEVEPSKKYAYDLYINGIKVVLPYETTFQTQNLWQWRTDPNTFTVAVGSCAYVNELKYDRPGKGYGGGYDIFKSIHEKSPNMMLWLGDNIYLREADWYTKTGIFHRYTHTRSLPEMQALLASTHHYAIWDDHDYGPNNSDRSFIHKDKTLEAFKLFWGNPSYGLPDTKGGITTAFKWEDMDFFLMDNRYFRTNDRINGGQQIVLGETQVEWLVEALAASSAPFKMVAVGGQVLNTVKDWENYNNHYWEERAYLLKRIEEERITGVIFLSGDRHHTELSEYTNSQGIKVYDLTVSPLTSGTGSNRDEINSLRVEGTLLVERNFGILEFAGSRTARTLTIKIYGIDGEEKWTHFIDTPKRPPRK